MGTTCRDTAINKITNMPEKRVSQVLIFMAGMEAEHDIGMSKDDVTEKSSNKSTKPKKTA